MSEANAEKSTVPAILLISADTALRHAVSDAALALDAAVIFSAGESLGAEDLSRSDYALAMVDLRAPETANAEFARALVAQSGTAELPVLVFAADAGQSHALFGRQFGLVDYYSSPGFDEVLGAKIALYLNLWRSRLELHQMIASLSDRNLRLENEVQQRLITEQQARHQAQHDGLTGLPNRLLFRDRAEMALQRAARHSNCLAVLFLDLDGFKAVNDQHGHAVGDALLVEVAQRLVKAVRKTDTVARLSGDEFAVVLEEVASASHAQLVAQKLCRFLAAPYSLTVAGTRVLVQHISASIGVAACPMHGDGVEALLRAADGAMYSSKRAGKNRVVLAPSDDLQAA